MPLNKQGWDCTACVYIAHCFLSAVAQCSCALDMSLIKSLLLMFYHPHIFLHWCPACSLCFKECSLSSLLLSACLHSIFQLGKEWQSTSNNNPCSLGCRCANKELPSVSLNCRYLLQNEVVKYYISSVVLVSYLGLTACIHLFSRINKESLGGLGSVIKELVSTIYKIKSSPEK